MSGHAGVDTAAQDQQPRVLAGVERVRHARAWAPPKAVWLVVVTGALPILAAETTMFAFPKLSRVHLRAPSVGSADAPKYFLMPSLRPASAYGIGMAVGVLGAWLPVSVDHQAQTGC